MRFKMEFWDKWKKESSEYARPIDGKGERVLIEQPNFPDWYLNEVEISEIVDYANEGNKSLQIQLKKLKLMYDLIKDNRW